MITINNSIFNAQGANNKDKVYGISIKGIEDVVISGCTFENTGYSAILNNGTGSVTVEGCTFECGTMYNPIEGSQAVDNGDVTVTGCTFNGAPGNNYINFYQVADGSTHVVEDCTFAPTVDNNTIRLSNRNNAEAKFIVKDCDITYAEGDVTEYTNIVLCQDYTSKTGKPQDFTKYSVELNNVTCDGVKVSKDEAPAKGGIFYVYEDGKGIITGQDNDPVISIR